MHGSIQPARLTRSRRAHLPAAALLLSGVLVAGCTGSSGHPATTAATRSAPSSANSSCLLPPVSSCYPPRQLRVAYGIQPLLDSGIDGRGETVTVLAPPPAANEPGAGAPATPPPGAVPATTDIRRDLAVFDRMFGLPAARIQVVTTLAGSASPWQASAEEVQDLEVVHAVAPAATVRVVLLPADVLDSAATATGSPGCGSPSPAPTWLRSAGAWGTLFHQGSGGPDAFHTAGAAAQHVTVAASSGDNRKRLPRPQHDFAPPVTYVDAVTAAAHLAPPAEERGPLASYWFSGTAGPIAR